MVQLLIQGVHYPTIRQESISIDQTANDPIPTFKFVLQDDPSGIALSELLDVIFLDESKIANPTHNFLLNPIVSPYTTSWTQITSTGGTFTNLSPGVRFTAANATGTFGLAQNTQNGLIAAGQQYMLSLTIATGTLTNCNAYYAITFLDVAGNSLGQLLNTVGSGVSATRFSLAGIAPTGATTIQVEFGVQQSNATNSGTVDVTNVQLEPMSFTSGNYQLSYPTPFCASAQTNCFVLPDGTAIRQSRLFGGLITKATAGRYIGNNRQWTVQVSGYAWLLQKQLLNNSWTNHTDAYIWGQIVSTYFPKSFSTAGVATGATLDNFGYTYNGTARDAADALANNATFFYTVDAYRTIIYQPPGYNTLPFQLSDSPNNVTSFEYYNYNRDIDATQLGNATLVTGASNISAVEYDAQSIGHYNQITNGQGIFWRTVNDSTITTTAAAQRRAIAENATYNYARPIIHLDTNQLMIPGYTVLFSSITDGLFEEKLLIQKSTLVLLGFQSLQTPTYQCTCELGAYNPDGTTITVRLLRKQQVSVNSIGTPIIGLMCTEELTYVDQIVVTQVVGSPATYGTGIYGTSVYAFAVPGVPTTTYGVGTYGGTNGYN